MYSIKGAMFSAPHQGILLHPTAPAIVIMPSAQIIHPVLLFLTLGAVLLASCAAAAAGRFLDECEDLFAARIFVKEPVLPSVWC